MPDNRLHFAYNVPVLVCLVDPQGEYDKELRQATFETTCGQTFILPRPAVELLYGLDPRPEEEIQITKRWSGKPRELPTWTVCLSPRSEQFRASEEIAASEAQEGSETTATLQASIDRAESQRPLKSPPTVIRKPAKKAEPQPRLFDRGTGTDGPVPQPQPIPAAIPAVAVAHNRIQYPDILRHIVRTVKSVLQEEKLQLGDDPTERLIVTLYIDACKKVRVEYDFSDRRPE